MMLMEFAELAFVGYRQKQGALASASRLILQEASPTRARSYRPKAALRRPFVFCL
jgi:hypothetical protein